MAEYNRREYLEKLISFANSEKAASHAQKIWENLDSVGTFLQMDKFSASDMLDGDNYVADYIRLVAAITSRRITDRYKNGKKYSQNDLKNYMVGLFFGADVENVFALLFDDDERLISAEELGNGTVNASAFLPRKLLEVAVRKKAKSVILVHNHPRGDTEPSSCDITTTYIVRDVLANACIKLLSHYVVAGFAVEDRICSVTGALNNSGVGLKHSLISAPTKKKGSSE